MHRNLILTALALFVLAAPATAQVHFARPTRDDAAAQLARPDPAADWQLVNLVTEPTVLPAGNCADLPGTSDAWVSGTVSTSGAKSVVVQIVADHSSLFEARCVVQTRIGGPDWMDASWVYNGVTSTSAVERLRYSQAAVLLDGAPSLSGGVIALGDEARLRCFYCSGTDPVTLTAAYMLVKR